MKKCWRVGWLPLALLGTVAVPVVALAPPRQPAPGPTTVGELAQRCRGAGAVGRDLVDEAIVAVAQAYGHYSVWHLWETPRRSLKSGRGWSHQYNTILLLVLRELGFRARLVHAARVRGFRRPWWLNGHTWVKVRIDGYDLDACASSAHNRLGSVNFVPLTPELPLRRVTRWALATAMFPFVAVEVWRSWLTGSPVADWAYEPRPDGDVTKAQ